MLFNSRIFTLALSLTLFSAASHASLHSTNGKPIAISTASFNGDLQYLKDELTRIKTTLITIKDSHNPSLISHTMNGISTTIKELMVVALSIALVGSAIYGGLLITMPFLEGFPDQIKQGIALCSLPVAFCAVVAVYVSLKMVARLIFGKTEQSPEDIAELLKALESSIIKVEYALRVVEKA